MSRSMAVYSYSCTLLELHWRAIDQQSSPDSRVDNASTAFCSSTEVHSNAGEGTLWDYVHSVPSDVLVTDINV